MMLEVPELTGRLELVSPELPATWYGDPETGGGSLLLELPEASAEQLSLVLKHEAGVPDGIRAGGDTLYLPHGSVIAPWSCQRTNRLPGASSGTSRLAGRSPRSRAFCCCSAESRYF